MRPCVCRKRAGGGGEGGTTTAIGAVKPTADDDADTDGDVFDIKTLTDMAHSLASPHPDAFLNTVLIACCRVRPTGPSFPFL